MALAFWVALTRVKDHWHHPGDVVAGSVIGAFIQVLKLCLNFLFLLEIMLFLLFRFSMLCLQ